MFRGWWLAGTLLVWLAGVAAPAQTSPMAALGRNVAKVSSPSPLPDAPMPVEADPVVENGPPRSRIDEILAGDPYLPLTKHQKWNHFLHRTYSSATFVGVAEDTVFTGATGEFIYCCGIDAWGKQYGANLADTESREFFGSFLFPTLLRQDPRYFPKRNGSRLGRAWYAATRVMVTRNDSGRETFNYSEVLGVAFTKALSNAYCPEHDRGGSSTFYNILGTVQSDATSNLVREFWPDMMKIVHRHTPKSLQSLEQRLEISSTSSQY